MTVHPPSPTSPPRRVRETGLAAMPALTHPEWAVRYPWLVQGTSVRGDAGAPFDLGMFAAASPALRMVDNWERLLEVSTLDRVVHARQVHGAEVRVHGEGAPGITVAPACDGHMTAAPGVLLAVTTADCVPITLVDPRSRTVAMVHAGWRGAAAGILERALTVMARAKVELRGLEVHLGPSICADCYEVGPEVFEALGCPAPNRPTPIDLRAILAKRAASAGVDPYRVTVSEHCTRCTGSGLFSHRGGDRERQVGFVGVRP